jgi:hypothetical protein
MNEAFRHQNNNISPFLIRGTSGNSIDKVRRCDEAVFPVELMIHKKRKETTSS